MNIALVIERMDTARGGREASTAQIAAGLARAGHRVTILCQQGSWRGEGVQVRELGRRGLFRLQRARNFAADAAAAIAEGRFDVVHAMTPVAGATLYQPRGGTLPGQVEGSFRRWGLLGPIRVGIFERLNAPRRFLARQEAALVADPRVMCLAVSQMVAEEFRRHYGRTGNVRMVYNGVDVPQADEAQRAAWRQELRKKLQIAQDDLMFLCVAKNFPLKGVAQTIRFFARWFHSRRDRRDARLVVLGRDHVEGYQRLASLREIGSRVALLPAADDVFRWYSAADVCVLLSWYDPCSRVVLEATRWGVPSITTLYNGAAELLAEGAGIVVSSPADGKAVVAAMERLADPANRAACADACRRVADHLSMDRHVRELLEAYEAARR